MSKIKRAIGLMSGTSMDGIDVAAIETDGQSDVKRHRFQGFPYDAEFRLRLQSAVQDARALQDRDARSGCLAEVERQSTRLHVEALQAFLQTLDWPPGAVDVVGYHGQTVLHRPEAALTVQLGDGQAVANATGIPVVYDLRAADVAVGGQGAPLAPVYHQALASSAFEQFPVAVVNIGGVGNVTWIGRDGHLVSFDTGPGNALIDDWVRARTDQTCDFNGEIAAQGAVNRALVERFLNHDYFLRRPPKSLDRDAWNIESLADLSLADGAATLTAVTADSIASSVSHMAEPPSTWVVCGGGRYNTTLMAMFANTVTGKVLTAEDAGWNGDSIEAEAWAYMAVRSLAGLPITFPGTTGVEAPQTGGVLCRPIIS